MAFLNRYASSRAVTCVTVPRAALRAVAALRAIAAGSVQPVEGASEALIIRDIAFHPSDSSSFPPGAMPDLLFP